MKFKYQIGQLVALRNHPYMEIKKDNEEETIKYKGSIINCSSDNYPIMMVKECIQSISKKEKLNEGTGEVEEKALAQRKYLCIWYDSFDGKFQEATLKEEVLVSFPKNLENPLGKEHVNIGDTIFINTSLVERYKQIHNQNRQNDRYVASSFLVIDKEYPSQSEWTNKLGYVEKIISSMMLKVKWFNVSKARYSEELIPYECFQAQPQMIDRNIWAYLGSTEDINHSYPNLLDMLPTKKSNYREQHGVDGKSLEELIYFYARSERKAIIDDRVNAFDRYLTINKYEILAHRVSLSSGDYAVYKNYKLPVDLILKDKNNNIIFIDILTGNSIIKDNNEEKPSIKEATLPIDDKYEYPVMSIYNFRMNIIKELIEEKYNKANPNPFYSFLESRSSSEYDKDKFKYKLVIINRKLDTLIHEVECVEDLHVTTELKKSLTRTSITANAPS
jgi:hypothetical protein